MVKSDEQLKEYKLLYKRAQRDGDRAQEAQWANSIADLLKNKGEYLEALRWLRIDYEISVKYLPQKQLLPTCQSLGEIYLRLERYKDALIYQKKHVALANDSNDIIEQQRANTQLGRTYHEMFLNTENDHTALRNAKKYLKCALKLARMLKEKPTCNRSSYSVKEYIDAHNNIGLLELDLDNVEEAEKVLLQGLKLCDEEEVSEFDDARTRLHNSLGRVYLELRDWDKARRHIEKDILICKKIGHILGESKGYVNLGEVHFRVQNYDDANRCYRKALDIASCLEDEDKLIDSINENFRTAKEASKVLEDLKKEEHKLKRLKRATLDAKGNATERKCLLEQYTCLDSLIEKAGTIFAWPKHLEFSKRKKRVASELCDKEKLSDAFQSIGESYQKLRNFTKASKWYMKSWNICRSIGNLEGQAVAKINIGSVLDSCGDWTHAWESFEEGYRIAVKGKILPLQKTALENMHYIQMIRFDNAEEARKLQLDIQNVEQLLNEGNNLRNERNDYCSETETEGGNISDNMSNACESPNGTSISNNINAADSEDFLPLTSFVKQTKDISSTKVSHIFIHENSIDNQFNSGQASSLRSFGRKRTRVVISDDEDDESKNMDQTRANNQDPRHDSVDTDIVKETSHHTSLKGTNSSHAPEQIEVSSCSFKSKDPDAPHSVESGSKLGSSFFSSNLLKDHDGAICSQKEDETNNYFACKIGQEFIHVDINSCIHGNKLDTESFKVEVACRYYLKLYIERRSKGLVPTIDHFKYNGKLIDQLEPFEATKDLQSGDIQLEAFISGWAPKRLMDMYIGCAEKLSVTPNMKLLKKLYVLEISEDEVNVSDCGLQDMSISPFLNALLAHKTLAVLDISHNFLGNETLEKLQQLFSSSVQKYGGLTLDLHCNQFGPTSLFQICECPVLLARLEVLNLSQNRLTDSCSSYLCTILQTCKALYSLSIEQCSITSRTIQKIADALHDDSVLSHLSIGKNNPVSGIAMASLLSKLTSLERFSELSVGGIRLNKGMIDGICKLASSSTLSGLLLGRSYIGMDGALMLSNALSCGPQELVKLDMSYCGLVSHNFSKISANLSLIGGLAELNFGGNFIGQEACKPLISMLLDPQCCLRILILDNCRLGISGIFQMISALSGNESLEELYLAENVSISQEKSKEYDQSLSLCLEDKMEVADSDDEEANRSFSRSSNGSKCEGTQLFQELAEAMGVCVHLQILDLSKNGFSSEVIDTLYDSWSSSRAAQGVKAYQHVELDQSMVHFASYGKQCCGVRSCCKKD